MTPMPEIPEDAIQAVAEKFYRAYDSEYGADHLTWRDFADQARELIEAAAPILAEHIAQRIIDTITGYPDNGATRPKVERGGHLNDAEWAARVARETFPPTKEQQP